MAETIRAVPDGHEVNGRDGGGAGDGGTLAEFLAGDSDLRDAVGRWLDTLVETAAEVGFWPRSVRAKQAAEKREGEETWHAAPEWTAEEARQHETCLRWEAELWESPELVERLVKRLSKANRAEYHRLVHGHARPFPLRVALPLEGWFTCMACGTLHEGDEAAIIEDRPMWSELEQALFYCIECIGAVFATLCRSTGRPLDPWATDPADKQTS